jgi:hypothetical protein
VRAASVKSNPEPATRSLTVWNEHLVSVGECRDASSRDN